MNDIAARYHCRILILLPLLFGCDTFAVRDAHVIQPPALYHEMWDSAQVCTGRRGRFSDLTFFVAEELESRGEILAGHYEPGEKVIYLLEGWENHPMVVKHEMIHALGVYPGHPAVPFESPCKATWETYGR